jgi:transcriptional regulator with XRE-family HTH domain
MFIGERLRELRAEKRLSQGDIENRTGLFRCYISRVENGHTVPSLGTLEKMARGLKVPMYQLFFDGDEVPRNLQPLGRVGNGEEWGKSGKKREYLMKLRKALSRMRPRDRKFLLFMVQKAAGKER